MKFLGFFVETIGRAAVIALSIMFFALNVKETFFAHTVFYLTFIILIIWTYKPTLTYIKTKRDENNGKTKRNK